MPPTQRPTATSITTTDTREGSTTSLRTWISWMWVPTFRDLWINQQCIPSTTWSPSTMVFPIRRVWIPSWTATLRLIPLERVLIRSMWIQSFQTVLNKLVFLSWIPVQSPSQSLPMAPFWSRISLCHIPIRIWPIIWTITTIWTSILSFIRWVQTLLWLVVAVRMEIISMVNMVETTREIRTITIRTMEIIRVITVRTITETKITMRIRTIQIVQIRLETIMEVISTSEIITATISTTIRETEITTREIKYFYSEKSSRSRITTLWQSDVLIMKISIIVAILLILMLSKRARTTVPHSWYEMCPIGMHSSACRMCSFSSETVLKIIDGYVKNKYDFFYLPMDQRTGCNLGYGYINMVDIQAVIDIYKNV